MIIVDKKRIYAEKVDEENLIRLFLYLTEEIKNKANNIQIKKEILNKINMANSFHHNITHKVIENIFHITGKKESEWIQGQQDLGVLEHDNKKVYFYNNEGGFYIGLSIKKELKDLSEQDFKDIDRMIEMFIFGLIDPKKYRVQIDYEMLKEETNKQRKINYEVLKEETGYKKDKNKFKI